MSTYQQLFQLLRLLVVSIAQDSVDPFEGLVVDDSFPKIHFSRIITTTAATSLEPSSIPMIIPIVISSDILVTHSTTIDQPTASIEFISTQLTQVKIHFHLQK